MIKDLFLTLTAITIMLSASCTKENTDLNPAANFENDTVILNDTITSSKMNITIGNRTLTATLVDNSSVDALKEALSAGSITIEMRDYGNMEKVGSLGRELPRNDQQITTEPGDLILYQGSAFVIYYAPNSWNFTPLGKIDNITQEKLINVLGSGDVTVTLSLP